MPPLQRARLLALLALLALCLALGQAKDTKANAEELAPQDAAVALGVLAALLLQLR